MSDERRLEELLLQWELSRQGGHTVSAENLCRDCPELLESFQRRLRESGMTGVTRSSGGPNKMPIDANARPTLDDFEIQGELGRGGMGIVFQALDRKRQRTVALKTLRKINPETLYRFKNEFRGLADVNHPNLVPLYELLSDGQTWFFTMELVPGVDFLSYVCTSDDSGQLSTVTLSPELRAECVRPRIEANAPGGPDTREPSQTPRIGDGEDAGTGHQPNLHVAPIHPGLSPSQVDRLRTVLKQLVFGLSALHEAGKLHRDVKPSNVRVTREGRLVILDFGLAADLGQTGPHGSPDDHIVGTANYMAPEQARNELATPASDWYSVGVMLYQALAGRTPFLGPRAKVLDDKQRIDPPAPREIANNVPDELNDLCVALLRRSPEDRPNGLEILRCLDDSSLAKDSTNHSRRQASRGLFVGRESQMASLENAYRQMRTGRAVSVFVQGNSGLGKSALVEHFLDSVRTQNDAVVLVGRCYERESVPYKALDSLVDNLSRYLASEPRHDAEAILPRDIQALARVFPVLRNVAAVAEAPGPSIETPDQQELRRRAFAALRELLARLGDRRPLVLFIDDMQWGDLDSAMLLRELLGPPDPPLLLMIGCYRREDATTSGFLRALLSSEETSPLSDRRDLSIDPLTPTEAHRLAQTLLGSTTDDASHAEMIVREAGGNPFFIYELAQSFHATSVPNTPGPDGALTLDKVLASRIEQLPTAACRLLEVIAVAGRPLGQVSACRAAELGEEDRAMLARLRSGHLIRGTGALIRDEIETYHDRIRETVVAHLTPAALKENHRRLAHTLEAEGSADPETLAVHFLGSENKNKAGHYYGLAADGAAEALAFDRAANLYRLSLQLSTMGPHEARKMRVKLGDALANAGRGAEAASEYEAAAETAARDEGLDLRRRAAYQHLISGHFDAGRAAISNVLKAVGMNLPGSPWRALLSLFFNRAWLRLRGLGFRQRDSSELSAAERTRLDICWSTAIGLGVIDIIRAADFQTRCLLLALKSGDPFHITRSLALEAIHNAAGGGATRVRTAKLLETADGLACKMTHPYSQGVVHLGQGAAAWLEGRFLDASAALAQAEDVLRNHCTGVAWELDTTLTYRLVNLVSLGHFGELSRLGPQLLRESLERGDLYAATNISAYVMPLVHLCADDPKNAWEVAEKALARWSQDGFHMQHLMGLLSQTEACLYRGDGQTAWNHLEAHWRAYTRSLLTRVQMAHIQALFTRARSAIAAACTAKDPRTFWKAAEYDARKLDRERMPWSIALAGLVRAGLAKARGERQRAGNELAGWIAKLDNLQGGLYAAAARRCLGLCLGGDDGRRLIAEADAWMSGQQIRNPARMAATLVPGFSSENH